MSIERAGLCHRALGVFLAFIALLAVPCPAAAVEPAVPEADSLRTEVTVLGDRGAQVLVDELPVGELPLLEGLSLSAGHHQVAVVRGRRRLERSIDVRAGRQMLLRFSLGTRVVVVSEVPVLLWPQAPDPAEAPLVEGAVARALSASTAVVLRQDAVQRRAPELVSCLASLPCQLNAAQRVGAQLILIVEAAADAQGPRLAARIYDVEIGEEAAAVTQRCPGCNATRTTRALVELLGQILSVSLGRERGRLEVTSDPAGAQVSIGGRERGAAPLSVPVFAGLARVALTHPGYHDQRREVQVTPEAMTRLRVTLALVPEPPPAEVIIREPTRPQVVVAPPVVASPARPRWRVLTGVTGAGLSAVVLGLGAAALYLDQRCTAAPQAPAQECPRLYQTQALGAGLVAGGAVLLAGGLFLTLWPPRRVIAERGAPR